MATSGKVAIGASGGKDSTVLAHVLHLLNRQYDYGLDLVLLSIDEGPLPLSRPQAQAHPACSALYFEA